MKIEPRFFWRSLAEMKRVLKPRGHLLLGAPGFTGRPAVKGLGRLGILAGPLGHSTLTLPVHNFPGDYYRFSAQAFREVFLADMDDVEMETLLNPPCVIGIGTKWI